eukprot:5348703-Prymnesium_polylepis.1
MVWTGERDLREREKQSGVSLAYGVPHVRRADPNRTCRGETQIRTRLAAILRLLAASPTGLAAESFAARPPNTARRPRDRVSSRLATCWPCRRSTCSTFASSAHQPTWWRACQ